VLTVYNPYALSLSFAVLCTAPALFSVYPATGELPQQSSVRIVVKQRHNAAVQAGRSSSDSSAHSTAAEKRRAVSREEQLMVEISNQDGQSVGRQIVSITCAARGGATQQQGAGEDELREEEDAAGAAGVQRLQHSDSAAAAGEGRSSGSGSASSWSSASSGSVRAVLLLLSHCLRLFPLLVGVLVVSRISSGELELAVDDPHAQLWLCFCIGMLTMLLQIKFLEVARGA
jgi:hypothetical protein